MATNQTEPKWRTQPSLATLSDHCLRSVFRRVCLVDRIWTIPRVCANWARVQRSTLTTEPHRVVLIAGNLDSRIDTDALILKQITVSDEYEQTNEPPPASVLHSVNHRPRGQYHTADQILANTIRMWTGGNPAYAFPPTYMQRRFLARLVATLPHVTDLVVVDNALVNEPFTADEHLQRVQCYYTELIARWRPTLRSFRLHLAKENIESNATKLIPRLLSVVGGRQRASVSPLTFGPPVRLLRWPRTTPTESVWLCFDVNHSDQPERNWLIGAWDELVEPVGFEYAVYAYTVVGNFSLPLKQQQSPRQFESRQYLLSQIAPSNLPLSSPSSPPPAPMSILPDLCLTSIFCRLSLASRICTIPLVCSNWTRVHRIDLSRPQRLVLSQNRLGLADTTVETLVNRANGGHDYRQNNEYKNCPPGAGDPLAMPNLARRSLASIHRCTIYLPEVAADEWPRGGHCRRWFTDRLLRTLPRVTDLVVVDPNNARLSVDHRFAHLQQLTRSLCHWTRSLRRVQLHLTGLTVAYVEERNDVLSHLMRVCGGPPRSDRNLELVPVPSHHRPLVRQLWATLMATDPHRNGSGIRSLFLSRSLVDLFAGLATDDQSATSKIPSGLRWFAFEHPIRPQSTQWLVDTVPRWLDTVHCRQLRFASIVLEPNQCGVPLDAFMDSPEGEPMDEQANLELLTSLSSSLATRLAVLQLHCTIATTPITEATLRRLLTADHRSLTSVRLGALHMCPAALIRCLSALPALTELQLHLCESSLTTTTTTTTEDQPSPQATPQLSSVVALSLYTDLEIGHIRIAAIHGSLAAALPALRVLRLDQHVPRCTDCPELMHSDYFEDNVQQLSGAIEMCAFRCFEPFKLQCTALSVVRVFVFSRGQHVLAVGMG